MIETDSSSSREASAAAATASQARGRVLSSWTTRRIIGVVLTYVALCAFSSLALFPLLWILSVSLQTAGGATLGIRIPIPPSLSSYSEAIVRLPLLTFLRNSTFITVTATIGAVLSTSLVGFSLARLRWPMRDAVFAQVIATMMMPGVVTLVPTFIMFKYLGWLDTFLPLIVPHWTGGAFFVFLMRQFMRSLPPEMDEAAKVDGASNLAVYLYVVLPLCGPVLAAICIFSFLNSWNDFLAPSIYLNSVGNYTLALGVNMYQGRYGNQWNLVMAASMFIVIPVLIVFLVAQRYFIRGIQLTGLAGR